jgi:outer membrane protein TolC
MPPFQNGAGWGIAGLLCAALFTGCTSAAKQANVAWRKPLPRPPQVAIFADNAPARPAENPSKAGSATVKVVSHEELADDLPLPASGGEDLFVGRSELELSELVREVQGRNQSLQALLAAWGAAAQRYPQVIALDDPMFQAMVAPASFAPSSNVQSSYIVGVSQKFPWAGKRETRGELALWNAVAASLDYDEAQLRLAEAARLAYYDYYFVFRQREVNDAGQAAVQSFRDTAKSKFEANQVPQQDLLQADVELAQLEQRRVEIDQAQQVATARINTLLHREPQLPLPPPLARLDVSGSVPDVDVLREQAVEKRPDLAALSARLNAEQNAWRLACAEYYPDFEIMGKYDTFWTDPEQRAQIAMNVNVPINQGRRQAAVHEAMFRVSKMQAEYNQQVDTVRSEVQIAHARLAASRRTAELYAGKLLPASQANVAAATSGYEAGTVDFLRLVQAQREYIDLSEKQQQAIVEFYRSRAELDRVVGAGL